MNDKKYYTPTIEEFHVGFEYEQLARIMQPKTDVPNIRWTSFVFQFNQAPYVLDGLSRNEYRVKYLDHDDIIAEGWGNCVVTMLDDTDRFGWCKTHYMLIEDSEQFIVYEKVTENNSVASSNIIFNGNIRNRSELRLIMKMLGIRNGK